MRTVLTRRRGTVVVAVLLIVVGAVLYVLRPSDDRREGSVVVDGPGPALTRSPPGSYSIVYRGEAYAGDEITQTTETLTVRRPFEARLETRSGPPPGEGLLNATVNSFARVRTGEGVFAVAPAPASLDPRLDPYLSDAARAGYALAREVRRVAGRECRIYRTQGPPSGPLTEVSADADEYTERCVDADGLVLEEITVTGGELALRRVAVRVEERPRIAADAFETGDPSLGVRQGGGSVQRLEPGSRTPGTFWEVPSDPEGFEREGRYAVIPPQAGFDDPLERGRIVAFVSDVWVFGGDVIVVEQGATLSGPAPFERTSDGIDVRLGSLGSGQLVYNPTSIEVRVLLDGGRFVRVFGTVPGGVLIDVARSLEEVEGGSVVVER